MNLRTLLRRDTYQPTRPNMHLLFVLLVLLGFVFWFLATWPVNYADRIAKGCWMAAAIIWAVPAFGGG